MTHSTRIASIHLLESGNIELDYVEDDASAVVPKGLERLAAILLLWDNPDFQAMLDKAIGADKGGVPFE